MSEKIMTTDEDLIYWCEECKIPIIKKQGEDLTCPCCNKTLIYLASDLRPVFPEERLLIELLVDKPLAFLEKSVWVFNNRYFIDGKVLTITSKHYKKYTSEELISSLNKYAFSNKSELYFLKKILNHFSSSLPALTSEVWKISTTLSLYCGKHLKNLSSVKQVNSLPSFV